MQRCFSPSHTNECLLALWKEDQGEDLGVIGLCVFPLMEPHGEPLAHPEGIWAQARDLCSPPSLAPAFCLCSTSDPKPKRRNGINCTMVLVITYLVLLTAGAGLLVIQGKASESCLVLPWVTMWPQMTGDSGSGESPGATAAHLLGESSQALGGQGGEGTGRESRKGNVCYVLHVCVYVCVWGGQGRGRQGEIDHTCVCLKQWKRQWFHTGVPYASHIKNSLSGWEGALFVCLLVLIYLFWLEASYFTIS